MIILWGIGNTLYNFMKTQSYNELKKQEIILYDKYKKIDQYESISVISNIWEKSIVECIDKIIIVSYSWQEIYSECINNQIEDKKIQIFDISDQMLKSYYTMCYDNYTFYQNSLMIEFKTREKTNSQAAYKAFEKDSNIVRNARYVNIMLSNQCNYATIHKLCPASCKSAKEIMQTSLIRMIYKDLNESGFRGILQFHIYNEPMNDPRLFLLIKEAKEVLKNVTISLYTNGFYLTDDIIPDLYENGVDILTTTGYGLEEYHRLMKLNIEIPFFVLGGNLDSRLDWYESKNPVKSVDERCGCFLNSINIYSNGDIGLCCLDYKHPYGLGNVKEMRLSEIMKQEKIIELQKELLVGDRTRYALCNNCGWSLY